MDPYLLFQEDTYIYSEFLSLDLDIINSRAYMEYVLCNCNHPNANIYETYINKKSDDYITIKYLLGYDTYKVRKININLSFYTDQELARLMEQETMILYMALDCQRYDALDILPNNLFKFNTYKNADLYIIRRNRLSIPKDIIKKYALEVYISDRTLFNDIKFYPTPHIVTELYKIKNYDHTFDILSHIDTNIYIDPYNHRSEESVAFAMLGLIDNNIDPKDKMSIAPYVPDGFFKGQIISDIRNVDNLKNWIHKYDERSILLASYQDIYYMKYMKNAPTSSISLFYNNNIITLAMNFNLSNINILITDMTALSDYDYITMINAGIKNISHSITVNYDCISLLRYMDYQPITSLSLNTIDTNINGDIKVFISGLRNLLKSKVSYNAMFVDFALRHYPHIIGDDVYVKYSKFTKKNNKNYINRYSFTHITITH